VRAWAAVALLACVLASFFFLAKSWGISAERPPSILAVCFVVIETFFGVVTQLVDARLGLKSSQIQEHYAFAVYWADGRLRIGWERKLGFEDVLSAAPNCLSFCLI
jgi:hypothetical protein